MKTEEAEIPQGIMDWGRVSWETAVMGFPSQRQLLTKYIQMKNGQGSQGRGHQSDVLLAVANGFRAFKVPSSVLHGLDELQHGW